MKYSTIPVAQTIVAHCKAKEIKHIVISPGSRNAPLTISFAADSYFKCFSIVDERCAAFFALGMAQQLQWPVALVCTSGSAVLNYYPAIAEAFYSRIPLLVLSADRPSYKIDIGDGQTIRQENVFKDHVGFSANLKQDVTHAKDTFIACDPKGYEAIGDQWEVQAYNEAQLEAASNLAIAKKLPVHVNVPFEEPLYHTTDSSTITAKFNVLKKNRWASTLEGQDHFWKEWRSSKKKMILIGASYPGTFHKKVLQNWGNDPSLVVFTETTSNAHHPNFFNSIDSLLAPIELSENSSELFLRLQPDMLITMGGLVVSKKIKAFLRRFKAASHFHIGETLANNTFFNDPIHINGSANELFNTLSESGLILESDYFEFWNTKKLNSRIKRQEYLKQASFSDFTVFDAVLQSIPKNYQLQVANSSAIRYTQLFDLDPTLKVFCNRGTSGIDGSTSTAIGAALIENGPTVFITGDISFFYDSNALWNNYIKPNFRIIVVNNGGGGIFRILPGVKDTKDFDTFFETHHDLNAQYLCEMFGLEYFSARSERNLNRQLSAFYDNSSRPKLLEIFTPRLNNDIILRDYFRFIS